MGKHHILLVEDDAGTRSLITLYLKKSGFHVEEAKDGEEALDVMFNKLIHLIVLDIEIPKIDGFAVCQRIREKSNVPIIFISNRRSAMDKIKSFELGGDDYLTKPFDFAELEARIKANLRRLQSVNEPHVINEVTSGAFRFNLDTYQCFINDAEINLTAKELKILELLVTHPNQYFTAEHIYDRIWELDQPSDTRTVRTHINNLRRKLEKDSHTSFIVTARGLGYRFVLSESS